MWDSNCCSLCPSAWGNPVWFPPGFRGMQVLELAGLSEYLSRTDISSDTLIAYSALDTLDLIFRTANKQSHGNQIQSCSAGFQAREGLTSLLVDLQQNWVHKPHPEFPASGPGRCGEWGWAFRGAWLPFCWTSCQVQLQHLSDFRCFAPRCTYNTIWPCLPMLYLG